MAGHRKKTGAFWTQRTVCRIQRSSGTAGRLAHMCRSTRLRTAAASSGCLQVYLFCHVFSLSVTFLPIAPSSQLAKPCSYGKSAGKTRVLVHCVRRQGLLISGTFWIGYQRVLAWIRLLLFSWCCSHGKVLSGGYRRSVFSRCCVRRSPAGCGTAGRCSGMRLILGSYANSRTAPLI